MPRRSSDELKEVIRDFRRDQIIDVARRLFGERGTVEVPIEDIAAEAGVARSTVYVYFANRDELVRACLNRMYVQVQESINAVFARETGPEERLRAVVAALIDRIDEHPSFFLLTVATQAGAHEPGAAAVGAELLLIGLDVARILEDLVTEGVHTGRFAPVDPSRAATLLGQQLFGALSVRAGDPSPLPSAAATDEICDFVLNGLRFRADPPGGD